jgi:hypothetical protein
MENDEKPYPWRVAIRKLQESIAGMNCLELASYLEKNWSNLSEVDISLYTREMVKKGCEQESTLPFLLRQVSLNDSFYRKEALNNIAKGGGTRYKKLFIDLARTDSDEDVRCSALMNLVDLFRDLRDEETLSLAYEIYSAQKSSIGLKLAGAATMMYLLGISHDENGRPAWWDEDAEDLNHPALQQAVSETKAILKIS